MKIDEVFTGIVSKVTYHNPQTGWSVLRVQPFNAICDQQETVTVYQTKVFAGSTLEFRGAWVVDRKYGRQFRADQVIEKKPATTASLEKYLGSGLIKGVGPKTAKQIVKYFKEQTLSVFESDIHRLMEVPGIAEKKLEQIESAWTEHQAIREVMMFLQDHGISTLFAVKIYKKYGNDAIKIVSQTPYRLANDFYGIGFFSADQVALRLGLAKDSPQRIMAAIKHVLSASREFGHCYLTFAQINSGITALLEASFEDQLPLYLLQMEQSHELKTRHISSIEGDGLAYYSKTLFYDEQQVAHKINQMKGRLMIDSARVEAWIKQYCQAAAIQLSEEQQQAIVHIVQYRCAILTGGPGCGKTTTTKVLVKLLRAMQKKVLLAAPTGRATQRMMEVIGVEAKTIHRLLEWKGGAFKMNADHPLDADFLIIDECSMLDISLSAALFSAIPETCQLLFIGDADQLPPVGAGHVLKDMIASAAIPCFQLTQIFRQAKHSKIIQYAHMINQSIVPPIQSPFKAPQLWEKKEDCLFIDADEATKEQLHFIAKVKQHFSWTTAEFQGMDNEESTEEAFEFHIPPQFQHVDLHQLQQTQTAVDALKLLLKKISPWSSLHYGLSAVDVVVQLYTQWIPKYYGVGIEIQILTPMTRGSLGSFQLNQVIQHKANPPGLDKKELKIGERIFREGDRVIHRKNNYDLNVFNGDIGKINSIDLDQLSCRIIFYPDHREVVYRKEDLMELDLAYAITIHKSQGSEFPVVILPVLSQHFKMLYRNLIYTGLTRAKKLAVFVGTRKAMSMAIHQQDPQDRQTALENLIR